ncbi:MAG: hypothetical protein CME06_08760 [Gemmatimonadetes bacterium]|nr:hypothetical protein [Gemmatimonadota bacterium]
MARFAIIGLGIFGEAALQSLIEGGHEVIGIDSELERVNALRDRGTQIVCLDDRNSDALRDTGAADVDVAIVALGEAFETAILAALNLRDLGVPQIIVRARNQRERRIFEALGVDRVVCPEEEAGHLIAQVLMDPEIHDWHRIGAGYSVAEPDAPRGIVGMAIADGELEHRFGLVLVAIRRSIDEKAHLILPRPGTSLHDGDRLLLAGSDRDLESFMELD